MDSHLRKRGWSESSINESKSTSFDETNIKHNNVGSISSNHRRRPRANTDHSEDTLTPTEKQELLNTFPSDLNEDVDEVIDEEKDKAMDGGHYDVNEKLEDNDDTDDEEDLIEMFGDDDSGEDQPKKKRRKLQNDDFGKKKNKIEEEKKINLEKAKMKLSKWSLRLFDPNRRRGLVEAPQVIPLNDEFLTQFGQREKEMDEAIGRDINIHIENLDEAIANVIADTDADDRNKDEKEKENKSNSTSEGFKVKIVNLAYSTSKARILLHCEKYGPVIQVNLLMDEHNEKLSKGRAYVIFESCDDRDTFVKNMNEKSLDGRIIRITAMTTDSEKKKSRNSIGGKGGVKARYWERDITTKCFRCGQVGHMSNNCPNDELKRPCPLCAKTGHDSFSCPLSRICFNCGVPGHVSRDCPERRGIPRRLVCTKCFISGHHRWECRERMSDVPNYNATCFVCGKEGHFMCSEMRWFFGLKGVTCFNCGESHHGSQCKRPSLDDCARNGEIVLNEIERAGALSMHQELEANRNRGRRSNHDNDRGRQRERDNYRSRAKSQPQQRKFNIEPQNSNYGKIQRSYDDQRHNSRRSDGDNRKRRSSRDNYRGSNERSHSRKRGYNT